VARPLEHVLIVGAGVMGLACAHYLNLEGAKVTVIDKGRVANACSKSNCGHILPSHILPLNSRSNLAKAIGSLFNRASPFRIKPSLDLNLATWFYAFLLNCKSAHKLRAASALAPLLTSSLDEFKRLSETLDMPSGLKEHGLLYLFQTQKSLDKFAKTNQWLSDNFDLKAEFYAANNLRNLAPCLVDDLAGGFFYDMDASIHPESLTSNWKDDLTRRGVTFVENCDLKDVVVRKGRVTKLSCAERCFNPDKVVFAMGAMSADLAKIFDIKIPVIPCKGYTMDIPQTERPLKRSLVLSEMGVAITPFDDAIRVGSILEFSGFDSHIPKFRLDYLYKSLQAVLKQELSSQSLNKWFGWRPMTPDSLPMIGPIHGLSNGFLATGHQMIGLMSAPATGRLISDFVMGRRPFIDAGEFCPNRFSK
jgi:D-amino-acid dehydrogenase